MVGYIFATIKTECYCKVGRAYEWRVRFSSRSIFRRDFGRFLYRPYRPSIPTHPTSHIRCTFPCTARICSCASPAKTITYPPHASVRHEHGPPRNTHPAHFPNNMTKRTLGIDGDQTADVVRREALDGVVNRQVIVDGVVDLDVARLLPRVPGRQRFLDGSGEGSACAAYAGDAARWQCRCSGHRDGGDPTGRRGGAGRSGQGAAEDGGGSATGEHGWRTLTHEFDWLNGRLTRHDYAVDKTFRDVIGKPKHRTKEFKSHM